MSDPLRARVTGPLEPFASGFAAELAGQGYTPKSAGQHVGLLAHVSRWLVEEGLDPGELTLEAAERFCAARRVAGYANQRTVRALVPAGALGDAPQLHAHTQADTPSHASFPAHSRNPPTRSDEPTASGQR